jgi:hypothetical protein
MGDPVRIFTVSKPAGDWSLEAGGSERHCQAVTGERRAADAENRKVSASGYIQPTAYSLLP